MFQSYVLFLRLCSDWVTPQNSVESLALATIANQLVNRPDMISQLGRHRWRAGQGRMHMAEVLYTQPVQNNAASRRSRAPDGVRVRRTRGFLQIPQ